MEVCVPLRSAFPPPLFEFRLLKVWQRLQHVLSATWRGHHPCWLSLEVSQLKGRPHHSLSNLACYNEMRALEQAFADDEFS